MSTRAGKEQGMLSMLFEMSCDDNPLLYDELVRSNKRPKRVNRLRFLAHESLLAQGWALVPAAAAGAAAGAAPPPPAPPAMDLGDPMPTNALLSPLLQDRVRGAAGMLSPRERMPCVFSLWRMLHRGDAGCSSSFLKIRNSWPTVTAPDRQAMLSRWWDLAEAR